MGTVTIIIVIFASGIYFDVVARRILKEIRELKDR